MNLLNNFIYALADLFDEDFPIASGSLSSSASTMARAGAEKRAATWQEKFERTNADLRAFIAARDGKAAAE
jgi:hypothetical protein